MNMTGNTILITGAGSGIGLALAREFARMDNQVIVAARSPDKLKAAEQRGLATIPADVSDAASIQALATRVMQEFPNTNVVVHNAAISKREDLVRGGDSNSLRSHVQRDESGPALVRPKPALSTQTAVDTSDRDCTALRSNRIRGEVPGYRSQRHALEGSGMKCRD